MLKLLIHSIISKYGYPKLYSYLLYAAISTLSITILFLLFIPVNSDTNNLNTGSQDNYIAKGSFAPDTRSSQNNNSLSYFRTGLFKSAAALQGTPLADKTIERIKSQLKLQCVMTINGELAAYINIQGVGMRKCVIGDTVNDMFTVLNINEDKRSVDLSIVDHKITLSL